MTIEVSDELYQRAQKIAVEQNIPVEQVFCTAFERALVEADRFDEKARRGSHSRFVSVMAKVPANDPDEADRY